ncbi:MAG: hypothetical protein IJ343_14200, partial [Clostridia bacterium]|nr:hypothetical protein [Clostridia bacterium]
THYTCDSGYAEEEHVLCEICGYGYVCEGGHGDAEGECGYVEPSPSPSEEPTPIPSTTWSSCENCGGWLANDETHEAPCGTHYTCDSGYAEEEHVLCEICGYGYVCEGGHGDGVCGSISAAANGDAGLMADSRSGFPLSCMAIAGLTILRPLKRRKEK